LLWGDSSIVCNPTGLFASCDQPSDRSDSKHLSRSEIACVCVFYFDLTSVRDFNLDHHVPRDQAGTSASPLTGRLATAFGRIKFTLRFGPTLRLPMLSTSSHNDAVSVDYRIKL